jgi:NADH:ubiquinone oxidoreductase subunit K
MEPLVNYLLISVTLFTIGVYGLVTKRNALRMLFAIEIIINSATLNFVAFSRFLSTPSITGQSIAMFAIALAAAEAAVGLAIILVTFRLKNDVDVSELKELRG